MKNQKINYQIVTQTFGRRKKHKKEHRKNRYKIMSKEDKQNNNNQTVNR